MNITFRTPGTFKAQSGGQDNAPGQGSGGTPVGLPSGVITPLMPAGEVPTLTQSYDEYFRLQSETTGEDLQKIPYRLLRPSTKQELNAKTGAEGKTTLHSTEMNPDELKLHYSGDRDINHGW